MPAASSAPRAQRLFVVLAGFFIANAIIAEFIGVKIFALEDTLGLQPFEISFVPGRRPCRPHTQAVSE